MALLKGKLFAGALFAGVLLGAQDQAPVEPPVPVQAQAPAINPGTGIYRSGKAYIWQDDAWVQVQKGARFHASSPSDFEVVTRSFVLTSSDIFTLSEKEVETHVTTEVQSRATSLSVTTQDGSPNVGTHEYSDTDTLQVSTAEAQLDWLSVDELLILLETVDA